MEIVFFWGGGGFDWISPLLNHAITGHVCWYCLAVSVPDWADWTPTVSVCIQNIYRPHGHQPQTYIIMQSCKNYSSNVCHRKTLTEIRLKLHPEIKTYFSFLGKPLVSTLCSTNSVMIRCRFFWCDVSDKVSVHFSFMARTDSVDRLIQVRFSWSNWGGLDELRTPDVNMNVGPSICVYRHISCWNSKQDYGRLDGARASGVNMLCPSYNILFSHLNLS